MFYLFDSGFSIILLIILFIVVFSKISNLKYRLTVLERRFSEKKEDTVAEVLNTAPGQLPNVSDLSVINNKENITIPPEVQYGPTTEDKFISWLKEDWLLKLGGLLLLIGLGWFTTYAFMNNWIGEFGRITLGLVVGVAVLALGSWRIKKYINQGGVFLVVGSAIILLTVFAAREIYDMFTPFFALILMFLSTAYISLVSVKYNTLAVSMSGLILAFLSPLLTNSSQANEIGLFAYLFVVTLGAIWIVAIRSNWGSLIFASLMGVSIYSLPIVSYYHRYNNDTLLWFAYGFAFVFFLSSIINILNSKENDIKAFLWTAVGNGAFLLLWIMSCVNSQWQSSIIALWMVIFAVGSFIAFSATKIKSVFYVYAGVAVAMLLTATTIELEGAALVVAFTLECFLIPVLTYYVTNDIRASAVGSLLTALPAVMSLYYLDLYYRSTSVITKDFFVVFLVVATLLSLGLIYKNINKIKNIPDFYLDSLFLIVGSVYAYVLVWAMFHVGIYPEVAAVTISLITFIIIGLVKYFYGISVGSKILRNYGAILIGFVILRLLFVDIWRMEISGKIVVFVLIGVLLMSTAFIGKRIKSGFTVDTDSQIKA